MDPSAARKDTVVGEIMYETQAIQDAMEGLGMSDYEDTSDEEEEARMKMLDVNQLSVISEESVTAVEQYFQKLLTVEEEKMSMKSYGTRDTSPRTTPHPAQPQVSLTDILFLALPGLNHSVLMPIIVLSKWNLLILLSRQRAVKQ